MSFSFFVAFKDILLSSSTLLLLLSDYSERIDGHESLLVESNFWLLLLNFCWFARSNKHQIIVHLFKIRLLIIQLLLDFLPKKTSLLLNVTILVLST